MITEEQKAYIGGFMDGEACIQMDNNGCISVSTGQVAKEPMELISDATGKSLTYIPERLSTRQRGMWNHTVSGTRAVELLRMVVPYLRVKRRQAVVALELLPLPANERRDRKDELSHLNHIGRTATKYPLPVTNTVYSPPRWSSVERAWHSGFFDAEGSVSGSKTSNRYTLLRAVVGQVNPDALVSVADSFAFPIYCTKQPNNRNARDFHMVLLTGDRGYTYLSLMYSFLLVKARPALVYLDNYDRSETHRRAAKEALDRMNAIGLVKTRELEIEELLDEYDPPVLDDVWSPHLITPFGELNPELLHFAAPAFLRCS